MIKASTSRLIELNALCKGHTLSFEHQPYFAELMRLVRGDGLITLVIGAGASIDSGLPTWPQLLGAMADLIKDDEIRAIAKADAADQLRKAATIQTLVLKSTGETRKGILRKALLPDDLNPTPGDLVASIARLVAVDLSRFRILTTNFDSILEEALGEQLDVPVQGVSLADFLSNPGRVNSTECHIVHLHGRVSKNDDPAPLLPLVLTESEFLRHGPEVKDAVRKAMLGASAVVFAGVSLTDPNLVGPLWDISNPKDPSAVPPEAAIPKYVLSVVDHPGGVDRVSFEVAARVARTKSLYLDDELKSRPILLKSYSQLVQAFNEMGLCAAVPSTYVLRPKTGKSTRYGARFTQALNQAYSGINASRKSNLPADASQVSDKLHGILYGRDGIVRLIERLLREKAGVASLDDERFGLFIWLRQRSAGGINAPYGVHLVGSSTYAHREEWSLERPDEISFNSDYMASRCLFMGGLQFTNVDLKRDRPPTWRGLMARPLILRGYTSDASASKKIDDMYDRLTLGSVTLNSTRCVLEDEISALAGKPMSALAVLKQHGAIQEISEAINTQVMSKVLFP